jgi:Uma2 family endonuclease
LDKAREYLDSGCQEVWLVVPETGFVFILSQIQKLWFGHGEVARTQVMLPGFTLAVNELLP